MWKMRLWTVTLLLQLAQVFSLSTTSLNSSVELKADNISHREPKCRLILTAKKSKKTWRFLFTFKDFPFYTLGRFSQDVCTGTNNLIGTCVLRGQCNDLGGTQTGAAACSQSNTFQAACCIVTKTCGGSTQFNNTYFVSSNYPLGYPGGGRCNLRVTRMGTDICQLKINFLDMSLAPPTGNFFKLKF